MDYQVVDPGSGDRLTLPAKKAMLACLDAGREI
jgi:hypothetical protein